MNGWMMLNISQLHSVQPYLSETTSLYFIGILGIFQTPKDSFASTLLSYFYRELSQLSVHSITLFIYLFLKKRHILSLKQGKTELYFNSKSTMCYLLISETAFLFTNLYQQLISMFVIQIEFYDEYKALNFEKVNKC